MPKPSNHDLAAAGRQVACELEAAGLTESARVVERLVDAVEPRPRQQNHVWDYLNRPYPDGYGRVADHPKLARARGDEVSRIRACLETDDVDTDDREAVWRALDEKRDAYRHAFPSAADTPRALAAHWPRLTIRTAMPAVVAARWRRNGTAS